MRCTIIMRLLVVTTVLVVGWLVADAAGGFVADWTDSDFVKGTENAWEKTKALAAILSGKTADRRKRLAAGADERRPHDGGITPTERLVLVNRPYFDALAERGTKVQRMKRHAKPGGGKHRDEFRNQRHRLKEHVEKGEFNSTLESDLKAAGIMNQTESCANNTNYSKNETQEDIKKNKRGIPLNDNLKEQTEEDHEGAVEKPSGTNGSSVSILPVSRAKRQQMGFLHYGKSSPQAIWGPKFDLSNLFDFDRHRN